MLVRRADDEVDLIGIVPQIDERRALRAVDEHLRASRLHPLHEARDVCDAPALHLDQAGRHQCRGVVDGRRDLVESNLAYLHATITRRQERKQHRRELVVRHNYRVTRAQ